MKLTDRQAILLKIIDDATERDDNGKLLRCFVPRHPSRGTYFFWFRGKKYETQVNGAGDANCLKGLERKGLIERPKTNLSGGYIYVITENGRVAMEQPEVRNLFEEPPITHSEDET